MAGTKGKSGGARQGAGRPATGRTKVRTQFSLSAEFLDLFYSRVPAGDRSRFIEEAVKEKLNRGPSLDT